MTVDWRRFNYIRLSLIFGGVLFFGILFGYAIFPRLLTNMLGKVTNWRFVSIVCVHRVNPYLFAGQSPETRLRGPGGVHESAVCNHNQIVRVQCDESG